jgi:hypothetical protein
MYVEHPRDRGTKVENMTKNDVRLQNEKMLLMNPDLIDEAESHKPWFNLV